MQDIVEDVIQLEYDERPLYRVNRNLAYKQEAIPRGSLRRLRHLGHKNERVLLERGTISEVVPPPLHILPGWQTRAAKLERGGITNAVQLLGVNVVQAAEFMNVKPETVKRWQSEVHNWLTAPSERRRR